VVTPDALRLQEAERLARQVLPAGDGWAAESGGTTGGSAATADQVVVARNWAELVMALGGNNATNADHATPKIVLVDGVIDGNVDEQNRSLSCADYADPGYSLEGYLATYDPDVWGKTPLSGPIEEARVRSAERQAERVRINVGSNTTIVGTGSARIVGANLLLTNAQNVIIRNLEFSDASDCFPKWDPMDGPTGAWNTLYDNVSLLGATRVWIDHCTFQNVDHLYGQGPIYFGRPYQTYDGLLDITRGSDFVTVSWNDFRDHDKAILIGGTNNPRDDRDKLRVTLHHNQFANLNQRAPRVRFGRVHVYNNYYVIPAREYFLYSWGVGVESLTYAENNFFLLGESVTAADLIYDFMGTAIHESGTLVEDAQGVNAASVLAAYNETHEPVLSADVGWAPDLRGPMLPADQVPLLVPQSVGANLLHAQSPQPNGQGLSQN